MLCFVQSVVQYLLFIIHFGIFHYSSSGQSDSDIDSDTKSSSGSNSESGKKSKKRKSGGESFFLKITGLPRKPGKPNDKQERKSYSKY